MSATRQQGLSLIETLIGMVIGLLLVGATLAVFLQSRTTARQTEIRIGIQDNARFAIEQLVTDLGMAGFLGGPQASSVSNADTSLNSFPLGNHCGPGAGTAAVNAWAFAIGTPIEFLDTATEAEVHAAFGCLGSQSIIDGSDAVAIRRARGAPDAEYDGGSLTGLSGNTVYLRTNNVSGSLVYLANASLAPLAGVDPSFPPFSYSKLVARAYFLRTYSETAGDGIPTLCRANLTGTQFDVECLAEGIEEMDIQFGLDTDGDQVADFATATPTAAQIAQAVTARVRLLVRSADPDPNYENDKSYDINGRVYQPADNYYRRMFDRAVNLYNPAIARGLTPT